MAGWPAHPGRSVHRVARDVAGSRRHQHREPRHRLRHAEFRAHERTRSKAKHDWIELSDLADALAAVTSPTSLFAPVATGDTSVILYGCDVGRRVKFVLMLGALFGGPAKIIAPRRVATFMLDATGAAQYRLSHSWSISSKLLPPMPSPATSPVAEFRTQFVQQAALDLRIESRPGPSARRRRPSSGTAVARTKATDSSGDPSFFVEGNDALTDAQVATLAPEANADPDSSGCPFYPAGSG